MSTDAGLTCPKCGSEWRSYERESSPPREERRAGGE